jgi:Ankyrin repeats (3 copies)
MSSGALFPRAHNKKRNIPCTHRRSGSFHIEKMEETESLEDAFCGLIAGRCAARTLADAASADGGDGGSMHRLLALCQGAADRWATKCGPQSDRTMEALLDALVAAGLSPDRALSSADAGSAAEESVQSVLALWDRRRGHTGGEAGHSRTDGPSGGAGGFIPATFPFEGVVASVRAFLEPNLPPSSANADMVDQWSTMWGRVELQAHVGAGCMLAATFRRALLALVRPKPDETMYEGAEMGAGVVARQFVEESAGQFLRVSEAVSLADGAASASAYVARGSMVRTFRSSVLLRKACAALHCGDAAELVASATRRTVGSGGGSEGSVGRVSSDPDPYDLLAVRCDPHGAAFITGRLLGVWRVDMAKSPGTPSRTMQVTMMVKRAAGSVPLLRGLVREVSNHLVVELAAKHDVTSIDLSFVDEEERPLEARWTKESEWLALSEIALLVLFHAGLSAGGRALELADEIKSESGAPTPPKLANSVAWAAWTGEETKRSGERVRGSSGASLLLDRPEVLLEVASFLGTPPMRGPARACAQLAAYSGDLAMLSVSSRVLFGSEAQPVATTADLIWWAGAGGEGHLFCGLWNGVLSSGERTVPARAVEGLRGAARGGLFEEFKSCVASLVDPENRRGAITAVLLGGARGGRADAVRWALGEEECDPNAKMGGTNALQLAASWGHSPVVAALADQCGDRLDVNAEDAKGRTALQLAAASGHVRVVETLVSAFGDRLDVNAKDSEGRTALQLAAAHAHAPVVEMLVTLCGEQIHGGTIQRAEAAVDSAAQWRLSRSERLSPHPHFTFGWPSTSSAAAAAAPRPPRWAEPGRLLQRRTEHDWPFFAGATVKKTWVAESVDGERRPTRHAGAFVATMRERDGVPWWDDVDLVESAADAFPSPSADRGSSGWLSTRFTKATTSSLSSSSPIVLPRSPVKVRAAVTLDSAPRELERRRSWIHARSYSVAACKQAFRRHGFPSTNRFLELVGSLQGEAVSSGRIPSIQLMFRACAIYDDVIMPPAALATCAAARLARTTAELVRVGGASVSRSEVQQLTAFISCVLSLRDDEPYTAEMEELRRALMYAGHRGRTPPGSRLSVDNVLAAFDAARARTLRRHP